MASSRKHPSRYPQRLTDLLSGLSISISFTTHQQAINFRYQLYAFRESLRKHPHYAPVLLDRANNTRLKVEDHTLHIIKSPSKSDT